MVQIISFLRWNTFKIYQNSNFLFSLPMESFFVANQFERHILLIFMIVGFYHLKEKERNNNLYIYPLSSTYEHNLD